MDGNVYYDCVVLLFYSLIVIVSVVQFEKYYGNIWVSFNKEVRIRILCLNKVE